jgi:conjugal transfer ATP-binding protein TraC
MAGEYRENVGERLGTGLRHLGARVRRYFRPPLPEVRASTLLAADALLERASLSEMLPYADLYEDGLLVLDGIDGLRIGFVIEYTPFSRIGTDAEPQVEGLLNLVNVPGAVLQFGQWSTHHIDPVIEAWAGSRIKGPETVAELAIHRRRFMLRAAGGRSIFSGRGFHPKEHRYFLTVTVPFEGSAHDAVAWPPFEEAMRKRRSVLVSAFRGMGLRAEALDDCRMRALLRGLLNPGLPLREIEAEESVTGGLDRAAALVDRSARLTVADSGALCFATAQAEQWLACVTVDGFPRQSYLPLTAWLTTGHPLRPQEMLPGPFYAYTNICIKDPDKATDKMQIKLAGVTRQLVSDSPAYRALMSHLFDQRDELRTLIHEAGSGHPLTQAYMGINLLGESENQLAERVSECSSFWKAHGFRASHEAYISLPVWLCSLPGYFTPLHDPTSKRAGLQRSCTMTSAQAAMIVPMAGDWKGTDPAGGGMLLLSRRGQIATVNVQDSESSNYNFAIIAATGAGKSFLAQEMLMDFLARDGYAFVIDAGRSYYELCEQLGGQNLVFKLDDPMNLNPFTNIKDEARLHEMMELLRELFRYMAFPQSSSTEAGVPDWQDAALEHAIEAAWREKGPDAWTGDVAAWLANHEDRRANDIADQLRTYTEGRLAPWFNGTGRPVDLREHFVVTELDDLQGQGAFRNIVLSMIMQRIADAMYTGDSAVPKIMLIDEAWDLLGSSQAGAFIERAYRTYRKYGGSAGVIMQSFQDFSRSAAAEAAFANSAWLFMLRQKPESLAAAFREERLHGDDLLRKALGTVSTVPGEYAEVYVRGDMGEGIYRFIADPYAAWLFTTNPKQKAERTKMCAAIRAEHSDWDYRQVLAEALRRLAQEKG